MVGTRCRVSVPPTARQHRPAELALAQSVSIRDHSRGSEDQYFGHPTCGGLDSQIRVFRALRTMAVDSQKTYFLSSNVIGCHRMSSQSGKIRRSALKKSF